MTRRPEAAPAGVPSPDAEPPPVKGRPRGISRTRQLPQARNALPGGAGEPSRVPRAGEAVRCPASAGTHLPGRHRARVPGGRSAGMVLAAPVRRAAELERPAGPRRRLGHFRARRRGGASAEGRGRLAGATCRSPGDALLAARAPEVRGGRAGPSSARSPRSPAVAAPSRSHARGSG